MQTTDQCHKPMTTFSQIGSKIYVKQSDLEDFLKSHKIEAKE